MSKPNNINTQEDLALTPDASSKIETIKNLIFGDNIKAYDSEFDSLKKDITQKRNELREFVDQTREELNSVIDNLSTDVNIRITELENGMNEKINDLKDSKVDRKVLGDLLIKLGTQINE